MEIGYFDFLEGLSPWWWVAFAIALGAVEMATMSFFLIWPGLAALVMAALVALMPSMPGEVQVALFGVMSMAATFVGRSWTRNFGDGGEPVTDLNNRTGQMVGRRGTLLSVRAGEATVEIDGVHWRAVLGPAQAITPGATVEVVGASGSTLEIKGLTSL